MQVCWPAGRGEGDLWRDKAFSGYLGEWGGVRKGGGGARGQVC